jgi:hypothetical protein
MVEKENGFSEPIPRHLLFFFANGFSVYARIRQSLAWFDSRGIFDKSGTAIESSKTDNPISKVDDMFRNDYQTALRIAGGKHSEADYIMNCSYFEWYNRIAHSIEYSDYINPKTNS